MKLLSKALVGVTLGVGALALLTANASAAVVCAGSVCWHVKERYEYPPDARVKVYDDNWRWRDDEKYEWREREGRGYWREDKWITW